MSIFSVEGKVFIVTGAANGNGNSICQGIVEAGGIAVGIDKVDAPDWVGPFLNCDVSERDVVEAFVDEVFETYGRLDGLVNNAGVSIDARMPYTDEDRLNFDLMLNVNLKAAFNLSCYCKEYLSRSDGGSIVNITSLGAHFGFRDNPWYQISKAGLSQATKCLALDMVDSGIRVNNLVPGYIKTSMTSSSSADESLSAIRMKRCIAGRWGESTDLIGPVLFLLSSASAYVNGSDLVVDGGWAANSGI